MLALIHPRLVAQPCRFYDLACDRCGLYGGVRPTCGGDMARCPYLDVAVAAPRSAKVAQALTALAFVVAVALLALQAR